MKYAVDGNTLTAIADAIRMKTETSGTMTTAEMPGKIIGIVPEDKPIELQSKSVSPSEEAQTVYPDIDQGYVGLSSVNVEGINPNYVGSGVTRKTAQTYTPGTTDQRIAAGQYLSGAQTIKGDANLKAENIKSGVNIFGVNGTANSGITLQRNAGTLTTNVDGYANVNVGFKPDMVLFKDFFVDQVNGEYQAAAIFSEKTDGRNLYTAAFSDVFFMGVHFILRQTDNGFEVYIFTLSDGNITHAVSNRQFPYVALKVS